MHLIEEYAAGAHRLLGSQATAIPAEVACRQMVCLSTACMLFSCWHVDRHSSKRKKEAPSNLTRHFLPKVFTQPTQAHGSVLLLLLTSTNSPTCRQQLASTLAGRNRHLMLGMIPTYAGTTGPLHQILAAPHVHGSTSCTPAAHHQGCSFLAKLDGHIEGEDVVWVNLLALPIVILHFQEVCAFPVH